MIGSTVSHYKIVEKLGEGGMGVVYKAEDTKLERPVALKFLPSHLLGDQEVSKRFKREAKAAAALSHSNVCTVYEIDEADGKTFIAMEFIEGESLDKQIEIGPLKLDEALDIAQQIAKGLEAAHEKGVVHRDIKPQNLMLGSKGHVTIMDFGLAQLTQASVLTRPDQTMGTTYYMSPEQTEGSGTDHRTDIWALGVVIYELVSGQRPFKGDYDKAIMYSILNEAPAPITALRTGVPMELEVLINKCLVKTREDRYQSASELIVDLRGVNSDKLTSKAVIATPSAAPTVRLSGRFGSWPIVAAVVLLAGAITFWAARPKDGQVDAWKITRVTSTPEWVHAASASTESSLVAYSGMASGNMDIYVMPVGGGKPLQLTTDVGDDDHPRLSPDGELVAYHSSVDGGTIYTVPITGGVARPLARTAWNQRLGMLGMLGQTPWRMRAGQRELLFSRWDGASGAIWKIDSASLDETQISQPREGEQHHHASYSPDGEQIVFTRLQSGSPDSIWTMPGEGGKPSPVLQDEFYNEAAAWTPDGTRLVFSSYRSGLQNLWELTVATGELHQITVGPGHDQRAFAVEGKGLFYIQFNHTLDLLKVNLTDRGHEALTAVSAVAQLNPRFSPDGRYLVFDSNRGGSNNHEISRLDLSSGEATPLTVNAANDRYPDWSPTSDELVFVSDRDGTPALWLMDWEGRDSRRLEVSPEAGRPALNTTIMNPPYGSPRWSSCPIQDEPEGEGDSNTR